jgi:exodeoxyribonuclease-5
MTTQTVQNKLVKELKYHPTDDQLQLIERLANYLTFQNRKDLFIIRGYAGTGKTTIIGSIVSTLKMLHFKSVLLAPTGRAAKVMSNYASIPAHTIHRYIYRVQDDGFGSAQFKRKENKAKNSVYIIDEASMISGEYDGQIHVLNDLLEFALESENARIIFVGDVAQLPPVHSELSPALIPIFFKNQYGLKVDGFELKQVVRQSNTSDILNLATYLRQVVEEGGELAIPYYNSDVRLINGYDFAEYLDSSLGKLGDSQAVVITRSNKSANQFNQHIRQRLLYREEEIASGDLMMVVQNNYHWLDEDAPMGFIANGDTIRIDRLGKKQFLGDFQFVEATVSFEDHEKQQPIDVLLMLNTIASDSASLTSIERRELYALVEERHIDAPNQKERKERIKNDPFLNSLQVKFAYAITGHKAQGGQWQDVYVDASFLSYVELDLDTLRWLYTACTRATSNLYLVNLPAQYMLE